MKALTTVLLSLFLVVGLSFLLSYPLMLLWNGCLVGAITIVAPVTWLQMWGISILFGLLFKSSTSSK